MKYVLLISFLALSSANPPTPFEITDNYLKGYADGMRDLKIEAKEYHVTERHFEEEYKGKEVKEDPLDYHYIVVGGGTAGAVLASRLSEIPEHLVLLLEAGGEETKITTIPAMSGGLLQHTHYDWGYKTTPQETWCLEKKDKKCHVPSGKILGGTSAVNNMIYTRGNARDFDLWADEGNKQWCYSDTLPYFKKSEDAHLYLFDRKTHAQGGLLSVEDARHQHNITHSFLKAGLELGSKVVDYNGKDQLGFSAVQLNTKDGVRASSFSAFIKPFLRRRNLIVRPFSHVTKILISEHTKEAQGVKYVHDGEIIVSKAKREIILTTGALNTPKILLLSGVGPKVELEKLGIECVHDLPVGLYLRDHPVFPHLQYYINDSHYHHDHEDSLVSYLRYGKGPLSAPNPEALAFIKTEASKDTAKYPDAFVTFIPLEDGFRLEVAAAHPKSHGDVSLYTKDPMHDPKININHFSDEDDHDIATILAGIRYIQKICSTDALKHAYLDHRPVEHCETHKFDSDEYWKCAIRHVAVTAGHYMGSCRMGKDEAKSVVDYNLRVNGIHKLRIADASVIPVAITGHTQAATIMIAEKAAEFIKEDWK